MMTCKILILGGGSGGISLAASLITNIDPRDITIVEPSEHHYYQPLWTLAGAGLVNKKSTQKNQKDLIPHGVNWIKEKVISIHPEEKKVFLTGDVTLKYDYLVIATGLKLDWHKISGLDHHLGSNGICSIYDYNQVDYTAKCLNQFQGGKALFVMPPVPIKCAGAPQKIMYMADDIFRQNGIRHKTSIQYVTAGKVMFGIPTFSDQLEKNIVAKNIEPLYSHKIVEINAAQKEAVFDVTSLDGQMSQKRISFDIIHLVPPMSPHSFISDSELSFKEGDQKGWLAVDKLTLQHLKFPEIFGIGDVTGIPNSKTGAAVRKQYPVVAKNLLSLMKNEKLGAQYDGYSSCPLITEIGKVMLAEFGYDGKLMPTFPLDPKVARRSYWLLNKDILPLFYWYVMLKGLG